MSPPAHSGYSMDKAFQAILEQNTLVVREVSKQMGISVLEMLERLLQFNYKLNLDYQNLPRSDQPNYKDCLA